MANRQLPSGKVDQQWEDLNLWSSRPNVTILSLGYRLPVELVSMKERSAFYHHNKDNLAIKLIDALKK